MLTMDASRAARLERLLDIQEINDALTHYCRARERCDIEGAKSLFHDDAVEDHGPYFGKAHDFIEMALPNLKTGFETLIRRVNGVSVEFTGETALSEASWFAILRDSFSDMFHAGRYLDHWERRQGEWKITARVSIIDWWRSEVRNSTPFPKGAEQMMKYAGRGFEDAHIRTALGLK